MSNEIIDIDEIKWFVRNVEIERKRHLAFIDPLIERLPDTSSIIVSQKIIYRNVPQLETTIILLPLKRYYKSGSEIVSDPYLLKEIQRTK